MKDENDIVANMHAMARALSNLKGCPHEERHLAQRQWMNTKSQEEVFCRACGRSLDHGEPKMLRSQYGELTFVAKRAKLKAEQSMMDLGTVHSPKSERAIWEQGDE